MKRNLDYLFEESYDISLKRFISFIHVSPDIDRGMKRYDSSPRLRSLTKTSRVVSSPSETEIYTPISDGASPLSRLCDSGVIHSYESAIRRPSSINIESQQRKNDDSLLDGNDTSSLIKNALIKNNEVVQPQVDNPNMSDSQSFVIAMNVDCRLHVEEVISLTPIETPVKRFISLLKVPSDIDCRLKRYDSSCSSTVRKRSISLRDADSRLEDSEDPTSIDSSPPLLQIDDTPLFLKSGSMDSIVLDDETSYRQSISGVSRLVRGRVPTVASLEPDFTGSSKECTAIESTCSSNIACESNPFSVILRLALRYKFVSTIMLSLIVCWGLLWINSMRIL